jgi:hypothetical protein
MLCSLMPHCTYQHYLRSYGCATLASRGLLAVLLLDDVVLDLKGGSSIVIAAAGIISSRLGPASETTVVQGRSWVSCRRQHAAAYRVVCPGCYCFVLLLLVKV